MIDTTDIYKIVEESSHETAFNRMQVEILSQLLSEQKEGATWVEIGVEYGRSMSVFAIWQKIKKAKFYAIDGWVQENSHEAKSHVENQIRKYNWDVNLISLTSQEAVKHWNKKQKIQVLHIDGDHTFDGVTTDINLWTPFVDNKGFVVFDDYATDSLPDVYSAVSKTLLSDERYMFLGRFADKMGVFQKL